MQNSYLLKQRLANHRLSGNGFGQPVEVVGWLGAVQAQDYPAAKWALGLRMQDATDQQIEQAFAEGAILRTHVLRPTWHLVTPADIRWMLALTAPRVHAANAYYYRREGLNELIFRRSNAALVEALQGGKYLTRKELSTVLEGAGIATQGLRLALIVMQAELEGVICSGPKRGKQYTYALLDERVPRTGQIERDEALARLALGYFTGHGPATVHDFAWWSGMTVAEAGRGIEITMPELEEENLDGKSYWLSPAGLAGAGRQTDAHLLPPYDEYMIAYKDRDPLLDPVRADVPENAIFNGVIEVGGLALGNWSRRLGRGTVSVELKPFGVLTEAESEAVEAAARRYAAFLGAELDVKWGGALPMHP